MSDKSVRFAIVGLGMGMSRADLCQQVAGAELAAVCDLDQQRGKRAEAKFNVPWIQDYKRLLQRDDVDVVFLLTPSGMHAEMGIEAAKAGKHVVCTKPLDVTLDAIDSLIDTCRQAGVLLAVDFQERYKPIVQRLRAAVDQGLFGKMILIQATLKWFRGAAYYEGWHGTWKYDGGGSLMNQTVHLIDLLQWLGGPIERVYGSVGIFTHQIETEDLGLGLVDFASGAKGLIIGTTTFPENRSYELELHGSGGAAAWGTLNGQYWKFTQGDTDLPARPEDAPNNIFEDVIAALRCGRKVLCDGVEGRKSVELILAVYKSAVEGRPIKLPISEFHPPNRL